MTPQDVTNILTAVLGIATVWLAIETRRMSKAAEAQIALQSQPYLAFRGFDIIQINTPDLRNGSSIPSIRIGLRLGNPGQVLISYKIELLQSSIETLSLTSFPYSTDGGTVHPSEETLFLLPFIQPIKNVPVSSQIDFDLKISYWSVPQQKKELGAKLRLQLLSLDPPNWQWVFAEGPVYS
jgi:hypothetical protein